MTRELEKFPNKFFSSVVTNLNLPQFIDQLINIGNVEDPVLKVKMKFVSHANIRTIKVRCPNNRFVFSKEI